MPEPASRLQSVAGGDEGFFDNVVTRDLAQAEREVALAANLRKADLLAIELETDKAEVETNKKASGLVAEIILLQRRQIDVRGFSRAPSS